VPSGWSVLWNDEDSFLIQARDAARAVSTNGLVDLSDDVVVMLQGASTLPE
jgi:hypothetical protein